MKRQVYYKLETHTRARAESIPDLEQIMTLSPAFRNSLANAYPIPEITKVQGKNGFHKDNQILKRKN